MTRFIYFHVDQWQLVWTMTVERANMSQSLCHVSLVMWSWY